MSDRVTFLVKTCLRPVAVHALMRSLRAFYRTAPVVVVDDGPPCPAAVDGFGVRYEVFPDDIGIGHCYNTAVRRWIDTPYLVLLDDDFIFTAESQVERLVDLIELGLGDLAGGMVRQPRSRKGTPYVGWLSIRDGRLYLRRLHALIDQAPIACNILPNFWAARTADVARVPWDEDLKVCRHEDYFLLWERAGLSCIYCPQVAVDHVPPTGESVPQAYRQRRNHRWQDYQQRFLAKWHLDPERGWAI